MFRLVIIHISNLLFYLAIEFILFMVYPKRIPVSYSCQHGCFRDFEESKNHIMQLGWQLEITNAWKSRKTSFFLFLSDVGGRF